MIYIKLDDDKNLVVTVSEPIYRGENLSQKIRYLVPLTVGVVNMEAATVFLNYVRADGTPDVVLLERQAEKYNESYYQYVLPVTSKLSKYAGEVCTWMQIYSGPTSNPTVTKSGECMLHIMESKNMDEYLDDHHVTALYQLQKEMGDGLSAVNGAIDTLIAEKADNIIFNSEDSTIQLSAHGTPIGDRITVSTKSGVAVADMKLSVDGELIVIFDNGEIKNLGKVVGADGVVYVPHVDAHKVLTFTIEKEPGDVPPPVDLNPSDEWGGMDDATVETDYIWETI